MFIFHMFSAKIPELNPPPPKLQIGVRYILILGLYFPSNIVREIK